MTNSKIKQNGNELENTAVAEQLDVLLRNAGIIVPYIEAVKKKHNLPMSPLYREIFRGFADENSLNINYRAAMSEIKKLDENTKKQLNEFLYTKTGVE